MTTLLCVSLAWLGGFAVGYWWCRRFFMKELKNFGKHATLCVPRGTTFQSPEHDFDLQLTEDIMVFSRTAPSDENADVYKILMDVKVPAIVERVEVETLPSTDWTVN